MKKHLISSIVVVVLVGICALATPAMAFAKSTDAQSCTITVDHGFSETDVLLDACTQGLLIAGSDLSGVQVTYIDTLGGVQLDQLTLNKQAQTAVREEVSQFATNFQAAYQTCANTNAHLKTYDYALDHLSAYWSEWGNPSQFVIDNISSAQFVSAC